MSKEAMKLALGKIKSARDCHPNAVDTLLFEAEEILEEARAKPDFWEGYVPEPVKPAQCKYPKCSYPCTDLPDCRDAEQPAQQALDKKAENARELGLDYEPAQQEPVAKHYVDGGHLVYPPAQRTWVGLTDEEIEKLDCVYPLWNDGESCTIMGIKDFARAIEAKLKEKNNG